MKLDEILHSAGKYKRSKRLGRGTGSGKGKTAGRGTKGAGARAGWKARLGKEGGQNPIFARIPKRGFTNANFKVTYQTVNVIDLEKFEDGAKIDAQTLLTARLISDLTKPVKILGNGDLKKKFTVVANRFSITAAAKIQQAGGTVEGEVTKPELPKPKEEPKAKVKDKVKAEGAAAPEGEAKEEAPKAKKPKAPKSPKGEADGKAG